MAALTVANGSSAVPVEDAFVTFPRGATNQSVAWPGVPVPRVSAIANPETDAKNETL
jgi:hypothetical protein